MPDLVITNATIVDGLGNPAFPGALGITGDTITEIWRDPNPEGFGEPSDTINAWGQVVCPGFVDIHTHSDWGIFEHPGAGSSLLMGVTSEIGGNCGTSLAPTSAALERYLKSIGRKSPERPGDIGEFLDRVDAIRPGNNQGTFLGQGAIRALVMGDAVRFPRDEERDLMIRLVRESMELGAFGMSTGRAYVPGCHGGFAEILALTEEIGRHRGLYTCHIADQWANIHRAVREVLELGLRTHAPVQIAHLKVVGKDHWGRMAEVLALIEDGRDAGVDVAADAYPYDYAAIAQLRDRLPPRMRSLAEGELLDLLGIDAGVEEIRRGWRENPDYGSARLPGLGVVWCAETPDAIGKDLGELAVEYRTDVAGAVARLLRSNALGVKVAGIMDEDDLRTALCHPLVAIGSDSGLRDPREDEAANPAASSVHPREYGTFPRVLGRYVREEGLLTLEEAIAKMTSLPAERIELPDRGSITRGHRADLVVFDPDTIIDLATPEDPMRPPAGISRVIVNGRIAVSDGKLTGQRAGGSLRDLQGRVIYG